MAGSSYGQMSYADLLALQRRFQDADAQSSHGGNAHGQALRGIDAELTRRAPGAATPAQAAAPAAPAAPAGPTANSVLDMINGYRNSPFATDLISDTSDDPYIDELLTSQQQPILGQLASLRSSGRLAGTGYDAAISELGRQRDTARGTLSGIGSGVIAGGRQSLYDILNEAQSAGVNNPGGFNLDPYKQRINDSAAAFKTSLNQKIKDTVGGTNYFNIDPILGSIPGAQGSTNTQSGSMVDALSRNQQSGAYNRPNTGIPNVNQQQSTQSPLAQLMNNRERRTNPSTLATSLGGGYRAAGGMSGGGSGSTARGVF